MIVAIAALALAGVAVVGALGVLRWHFRVVERAERTHAARVDGLLDRLMHATDKTWNLPPAARDDEPEPDPYDGVIMHPEETIDYPASRYEQIEQQLARAGNGHAAQPEFFTPEDIGELR